MVKRSLWLVPAGVVAAFVPSVAFGATDTVDPVMAAATGAVTTQQGLLMGGLTAVVVFAVIVAMTLWGVPKATRFFKRIAA